MKLMRVAGLVAGLMALLTACDQASSAADKASACAEALGLANINPDIDPAKLVGEAAQKADRLRQLANQVSDQDLKQNLFLLADSFVALEKRKVSDLSDLNDWLQRNADNLTKLRAVCL